MADLRAASRYVKSLLSLAVEKNALEEVHRDMQLFAKICSENKSFGFMLKNPIISHEKKRDILTALFKGKVHTLTMAFLDIITKKNREPLLPSIAREFHNAYNEYKGIGFVSVTTAVPMDSSTRADIEKIAMGLTDKASIELVQKVDPELIGGFVLNVGDRQIDASVKSKLKDLRKRFKYNPYIKEF